MEATYGKAPELEVLTDLDAGWAARGHGARLTGVLRGARALRERFSSGPRCLAVRTLPISYLVYPTRFAFFGMALTPAPYVVMCHRALLVQFLQGGQVKHLLFNPSDDIAARETPYFKRLAARFNEKLAYTLFANKFDSLETQLSTLGLTPEDIDYVAFDHFHTQDLRSLLGNERQPPRFANAKLLAPKVEWEDWDDLHPMQQAWFIADGKKGVSTNQVVLTKNDLMLGDGVMLLRTPGHTSGNQTLFVNTQSGVWGCSENGTSCDSWSPHDSGIAGLRSAVRYGSIDVVLNANTPEYGADQYTSMVLERTVVDRVERAPAFAQMFPSSEVTPSPFAPGISPRMVHGEIRHGELTLSRSARPAVTAQAAQ